MAHKLIKDGDLVLYGTVGGDFWSDGGFTDAEVLDALTELDGDLNVRINSGGGNAFMGIAIYNALKVRDGKVTVQIDGIAASAASIIAMAGEEIVMRDGSLMMIHNSSSITIGTAKDHEKSIEAMQRLDGEMAKLYSKRTGVKEKDAKAMMDEETWMTGDEAVKKGFATKAGEDKAMEAAMFDYRLYARAPEPLRLMASAFKQFQKSGHLPPQSRSPSIGTESGGAAPGEDEMDMKSLTLSALREQRPDLYDEIFAYACEQAAKKASKKEAAAPPDCSCDPDAENYDPDCECPDEEEMSAKAVKAERERILGIQAACFPGQEKLAEKLINSGASVGAAALAFNKAMKASGNKVLLDLDEDEAKLKGLRSEFKPANDGTDKGSKPGAGLEGEAKWSAEYDASADLQREFGAFGGKTAYIAAMKAEADGRVRSFTPGRRH